MATGLRRSLFRIWLVLSAGWIMSWLIDLVLGVLEDGFKTSDLLVMPVLLFAPPIALLIFGFGAGWAFRGFKVDDSPSDESIQQSRTCYYHRHILTKKSESNIVIDRITLCEAPDRLRIAAHPRIAHIQEPSGPGEIRPFTHRADSDEAGHAFQFDGGHPAAASTIPAGVP